MTDPVADALVAIKNAERVGKTSCVLKPASKMLGDVLKVMQKKGYIGQFEFVDDGRAGQYRVQLIGRINNCGAIKPNYYVKKDEYEKYEKRYLPGQNIGVLVVSTPSGLLSQEEAMKRNTGGRLIAYVY